MHDLKEGASHTPDQGGPMKEALSQVFEGGEAAWMEGEQDRIPDKETGYELTYRQTISAPLPKAVLPPKSSVEHIP